MVALEISAWGKIFGEEIVFNYSRLGETVHPFMDFAINISVFFHSLKAVLINDLIKYDVHRKANVLIPTEGNYTFYLTKKSC